LGVFECRADFVGGADVVGEFDTRRTMSAESRPKAKHHSSGLEEADFVVRLLGATPTESFIERPCPAQIVDAEGHETDALLHVRILAHGVLAVPRRWAWVS
jgi:hypothetical protein